MQVLTELIDKAVNFRSLDPSKAQLRFVAVLGLWISAAMGLSAQAPLPATNAGNLTLLEAARSTLLSSPQLHLQEQQVVINEGIRQQFTGLFDLTYNAGYQQGYTHLPLTRLLAEQAAASGIIANDQLTDLATFNFNASKLFRTGIQVGPVVQSTRTVDNLSNLFGVNRTSTDFQISIPLLRNRGREVVAAQETSAFLQIDASRYDLRQVITDLLAGVASAYWQYLAALNNLSVSRGSEDRGRTLLENVQALIDADRIPRSEINQAVANLADRIANRINAEQQVVQAQQQLALAMGLMANQVTTVGTPADQFPDGEALPVLSSDPTVLQKYVDLALARRADIFADKKRVEAAQVQKVAAANQMLPSLNLTFSTGVSGLGEGTFFTNLLASPARSVRGLDAVGGINFSFPPANNAARGQFEQASATVRQAQLQVLDVSRNIAANVTVAYHGLRNAQARLVEARRSVEAFQTSLDNEREKLRLGIGSIVDTLTIEDRLTTAQASQVSARLNFALALTQMRQATGTLVDPNGTSTNINRDIFFNIPSTERP